MSYGQGWGNAAGAALQIYIGENIPRKHHEDADPKTAPLHSPSEILREESGHKLIKTWQGNFYDSFKRHGWRYMGRCMSDEDAVARWERWLRTQGVEL